MKTDSDGVCVKKKIVPVRFASSDWKEIVDAADKANLTVSEYVRRCVLSRTISYVPNLSLLKELRRISALMKQMSPPLPPDRQQWNDLCKALREVFGGLCK